MENNNKKIEFKHCDNFGLSFAFCCGFYQYGNVCWSGSNADVFVKGEALEGFTAQLSIMKEGDLLDAARWSIYDENTEKEYTLDEFCAEYGK